MNPIVAVADAAERDFYTNRSMETLLEKEVTYNNRDYILVPIDSYIFEYVLVEGEPSPLSPRSVEDLPPGPLKLVRTYHSRNEHVLIYRQKYTQDGITSYFEKSDMVIKTTDYVPYNWVPVCIDGDYKIHWYKEKN
jgi:hypothetical protein